MTRGAVGDGADDWDAHWARYGKRARINPGQLMRFKWLAKQVLADVVTQKNPVIVDIGSGTGHFLELIGREFPSLPSAGLEYSAQGVRIAKGLVPFASFYQVDLLQPAPLPPAWRPGTIGTCSEVLEHVDDPTLLMTNARKYFAAGAVVHVTVPGGPMSRFDKEIGHRRHFTPEALSLVMEGAGYETLEARSIGFPFFNLYRLLVVASGDRVQSLATVEPTPVEIVASKVFSLLMRFNVDAIPQGYQVVGTFRAK